MRNVKSAIPLTDQTNPNKFPKIEFREYPKMMLKEGNKPFIDPTTRQPVIVNSAEEEDEFRAAHDNVITITSQADQLAELRAENERLQRLLKGEAGASDEDESEAAQAPAGNALGSLTASAKTSTKRVATRRMAPG